MTPKFVLLAAAVGSLAGCGFPTVSTGPVIHETKSVDLDKAEMDRVEIKMYAGHLNVSGGSPHLLDADFTYNVASWKPEVRYSNTGVRGELSIQQPSGSNSSMGDVNYTWDLKFNDHVPIDMTASFGAGEADLNVGTLSLRTLGIEMGAGNLKVDMRGHLTRSCDVHIRGGVGEAHIYLPKDAGIEAQATGGIGEIKVRGLHNDEGRYVNDLYRTANVKIHLDIAGGVGNIELIAE